MFNIVHCNYVKVLVYYKEVNKIRKVHFHFQSSVKPKKRILINFCSIEISTSLSAMVLSH